MTSTVKVVQPSGILDSTQSGQFRQEIIDIVQAQTEVIIIDFKDVSFMDSSGLGALVLSLKAVRAAGGQMFICSINEQIKMLFELTSMDQVFEIFPNREELEKEKLGLDLSNKT
jgi:anti-anti-sigma factor